jgi:hypothetical protein
MCHVSHRLASRGPNWIVPGASVQSTIFLVSMCQTIGMMHWTAGPHNVLSRSKGSSDDLGFAGILPAA